MFIEEDVIRIGKDKWHRHTHELQEIRNALSLILKQNKKIMATVQDLKSQVADLNSKVDDLQTSLDAEQAQIQGLLDTNAQVVTDLNAKISELQAIIDAGGTVTPEDLQAISDGIKTATDKITTEKADLEGTVADTPPTA